jgi:hypothetical protein
MRTPTPAVLILLSSVCAFGKYYEANRYDVKLHLDSRGGLTVTETVAFRFVAGPFSYVFREIAATETDGIENVQASMDGQPCASGTGPGEVEILGSSPVMVRWHFAEILSGTHTFTVQYRAAGTVRPSGDAQTLVWRVLPQQRSYGIGASAIDLEYPPGVAPRAVALRSGAPDFEIGHGSAHAMMVNPPMAADVILNAQFPAGSFTGPAPAWQAAEVRRERDFRRGLRDGAVVSAILVALACLWMFRIRADARPGATGLGYDMTIVSPPSSLPPALAGRLIGKAGGLGTLLDLARRGVLRIEEFKGGFLRSRQFQVVLIDGSAQLARHERVLLEVVFRQGETTVPLQSFFSQRARGAKFVAALREELKAAGLIDDTRARARLRLLVAGGIGLAAGAALLAMGIASGKPAEFSYLAAGAMVVGGAMAAAGVLGLILGSIQPVWSDAGAVAAAQWKSFARYLAQAGLGRAALPDPAECELLLPYAAALGWAAHLLMQQKKRGGFALPPWFQAFQTSDGSDFNAFAALMVCDSQGSGGGGGFGGGGGASGGGASGAG